MNRNNSGIYNIDAVSKILAQETDSAALKNFMIEMLTKAELETLSKRWRILEMLAAGRTQRAIAEELRVSLCKVTRGAHILKNKNSIAAKYLIRRQKEQ